MDDPTSLPLKVTIAVSLSPSYSSLDSAQLRTGLGDFLDRLFSGLGLQLEPVVDIEFDTEGKASSQELAITIDGQECRQPHRAAQGETLSLPGLFDQVCEVLLLNRTRVVTEELAGDIHKRRFFQTEFSAQQVAEMAVDVVRLGFSLEKLTALTLLPQSLAQTGQDVTDFIETALDGFDTCDLKVRLGAGILELSTYLSDRLQTLREETFKATGILLPPVTVETSTEIPDRAYQLILNGLFYPPYPAFPPSPSKSNGEDLLEHCLARLKSAIQKNLGAFINRSLVEYWLANLGASQPELVKAVNARWQIQDLTRILRRLVEEFSIRDMSSVLTACALCPDSFPVDPSDSVLLFPEPVESVPEIGTGQAGAHPLDGDISAVRANLRFQIWKSYAPVYQVLYLVELEDDSLAQVANAARAGLSELAREQFLQSIYALVDQAGPDQVPVVLTSMPLRATLRRMIEIELPDVPVLSYQDLPASIIAGAGAM